MTKVYNRFFKKSMDVVAFYDSGDKAIYKDALKELARVLKARLKAKRQNVVLVTGPTGSGKSTVAIQLARFMDPKWRIDENYVYSSKDLKRKLKDPSSSPITLFDEASVSLNSSNSQRKDDKMMVVLFDTMRSLGWTSILCIPDEMSLNKRVREYHVDFMLKCPARSPLIGYDPRGIVNIYKREYRDFGKPYYQLWGASLYDKLQPGIDSQYQAIKREHQRQLIAEFIGDEGEGEEE